MLKKIASSYIVLMLIISAFVGITFIATTNTVRADPPGWWNANWTCRKLITIDSSQINNNLINFSFPINITDADLATYAQSDADDIIFVLWSDNTTQLNHEIEYYNSTIGKLVAHFNTTLSSSSDTKVWMYYGNASATNQENPTAVWDRNYSMVQHFQETGTVKYDSTSNAKHCTASGTTNVNTSILGKGEFYNVAGDKISTNATWSAMGIFTLECWVKFNHTTIYTADLFMALPTNDPSIYRTSASDTIQAYVDGTEFYLVGTTDVNDTDWHYVVVTADGTTIKLYVDGALDDSNAWSGTTTAGKKFWLGDNSVGSDTFNGTIDEARISDSARNSTWIKATYDAINQTTGFVTFGAEESINAPINSNPQPSDGATNLDINPYLNITVTDANGDTMNVTKSTNASGVWTTIFWLNNTGNTTMSNLTSGIFTDYGTKYWWNVSTNDGMGYWDNDTYSFTTKPIDTSVDTISPFVQTSSPLLINVSHYGLTLDNVTLYYRYSSGSNGTTIKYMQSFPRMDVFRHGVDTSYFDYPNSQVIIDGINYATSLYSGAIVIVNCTNSSNLTQLTYKQNASVSSVHDGYPTPDAKFMYTLTSASPYLLGMWNVSDVTSPPVMVNHTSPVGSASGMYLYIPKSGKYSNYLFVTTQNDVRIYNITNRNTTYQMDFITSFSDANVSGLLYWHTKVFGDYLYVMPGYGANYDGGILIYNISNISSPSKVRHLNSTAFYAYEPIATVINGYDYLIGARVDKHPSGWMWSHITVWNLSAPGSDYSDPEFMYDYRTNPNGESNYTNIAFTVINNYVVVMCWNVNVSAYQGGIAIYNFTDVNNPSFVEKIGGKGAPSYLNLAHYIDIDENESDRSVYVMTQNDDNFNVYDPVWTNVTVGFDSWVQYSTPDTTAPYNWSFNFPNGTGTYEFYSIGQESGSPIETTPTTADASCSFSISTNTSVDAIVPYDQNVSPITVNATGSSSLSNVTLWYRYSTDNRTFNTTNHGVTFENALDLKNGDDPNVYLTYPNSAFVRDNGSRILIYNAVLTSGRFQILDVTNAWNYTVLDDISANQAHDVELMEYDDYGLVAFVLGYTSDTLYVFNVTNPNNIVLMDTLSGAGAPNYLDTGMYLGLDEDREILFATSLDDDAILSIDISDPNNLTLLDVKHGASAGILDPWSIIVDDEYDFIYIVCNGAGYQGIVTYNVSNTSNITFVKNLSGPFVYLNYKDGNYYYASNSTSKELYIWNITDRLNWSLLSNTYQDVAGPIWVDSNYSHYAFITEHDQNGFIVDDVTNKSNPVKLANVTTPSGLHWLETHYNRYTKQINLYALTYTTSSLQIYNITFNESLGGFIKWTNASNPDTTYPWQFNFSFPNGTGYYEFASVGNKSGSLNETLPDTGDAMCYYSPILNQAPNQPTNESPTNNSDYIVPETYMNVTVTDPDADNMTVEFRWQNGSLITTVVNVTNSSTASIYLPTYQLIQHDTNYSWYVVVDDGTTNTTSPTWNFNTSKAWDLNGDKTVNYLDASIFVGAYGSSGTPGFIASDINNDGVVNYLDASLLVGHYGESY